MSCENIEELNFSDAPCQQRLECCIYFFMRQRLAEKRAHPVADTLDAKRERLFAAGAFKVKDFRAGCHAIGPLTLERNMVKELGARLHQRNKVRIHIQVERIQLNRTGTIFSLQKTCALKQIFRRNFTIGLTLIALETE